MMETLFDTPTLTYDEWVKVGHLNGWLGSRSTDPETSKTATASLTVRAGSQRHRLLQTYAAALSGLTDEEAGNASGLAQLPKCCYWKRCSELRQAGYIAPTGDTRLSSAEERQQVCRITDTGRQLLADM